MSNQNQTTFKFTPPDLSICKSYEIFTKELRIWEVTSDVPKVKMGALVASKLPNEYNQKKNIRDKFYSYEIFKT